MAPLIARADRINRDELTRFLADRHRALLVTSRRDAGPQASPVTCGTDSAGRLMVSSYPARAKVANIRRAARAGACVLSDDWDGLWLQVDGPAEVLDLPEAPDGLVEYCRCIAGEHRSWAEYRHATRRRGKRLIRLTIESWGPIASGGYPPEHAPS